MIQCINCEDFLSNSSSKAPKSGNNYKPNKAPKSGNNHKSSKAPKSRNNYKSSNVQKDYLDTASYFYQCASLEASHTSGSFMAEQIIVPTVLCILLVRIKSFLELSQMTNLLWI